MLIFPECLGHIELQLYTFTGSKDHPHHVSFVTACLICQCCQSTSTSPAVRIHFTLIYPDGYAASPHQQKATQYKTTSPADQEKPTSPKLTFIFTNAWDLLEGSSTFLALRRGMSPADRKRVRSVAWGVKTVWGVLALPWSTCALAFELPLWQDE